MDRQIAEIERRTALDIEVVGRLPGGEQGGAYLVRAAGRPLVLKLQPDPRRAERLLRAVPLVEEAVERGWPAAAWLFSGRLEGGTAFLLQEHVEGEPIGALDAPALRAVLQGNRRQSGLASTCAADDSERLLAVVSGEHPWTASVRDHSPDGAAVVRHGHAVVRRLGRVDLPTTDLVHGDYSTTNLLLTPEGSVRFVDAETIARGTRVRDLADLLRQCFVHPGTAPTVLEALIDHACSVAGPAVLSTCAVAVSYDNLAWWVENRTVAEFDHACERVHHLLDTLDQLG